MSDATMDDSTEINRTHLSQVELDPTKSRESKVLGGLGRHALPAEPGGPGLRPAGLGLPRRRV